MEYGFGYGIVEKTNGYSGGEKHAKIRDIAEFGLVVHFSQLQFTVFGKVNDQQEKEPDILGADVQPGELVCDPLFGIFQSFRSCLRVQNAPYHKSPNDKCRGKRYYGIKVEMDGTEFCLESTTSLFRVRHDSMVQCEGAYGVLCVLWAHFNTPILLITGH